VVKTRECFQLFFVLDRDPFLPSVDFGADIL
jgi:hypothetical protein